jgi:mono/diheme cytochrome c family protein
MARNHRRYLANFFHAHIRRRRVDYTTLSLVVALLCLNGASYAGDATLTIQLGADTHTYTQSALLARDDVISLPVPDDPDYRGKLGNVRAIRLDHLIDLKDVRSDGSIEIKALDGFTASFDRKRLFGRAAIAYLAIEPSPGAWPPLRQGDPKSAAPFYLVWQHGPDDRPGNEDWPFQIASITQRAPLSELYPAILPDPSVPRDSPVRTGFEIFQRTCFACHTLNKQGSSAFGPDLNVPYSPTEYLQPGMLQRLVRNPQALRRWPQAHMPPFDRTQLSDQDLAAVEAYLHHMAGHKVQ